MNFDELDQKMRVFETAHDYCVLPELYMVARIDGCSFIKDDYAVFIETIIRNSEEAT
jgi:hypothetical protein